MQTNPGTRPSAWWLFEPGVPDDLRDVESFARAHPELEAEAMGMQFLLGAQFGWDHLYGEARRAFLGETRRLTIREIKRR